MHFDSRLIRTTVNLHVFNKAIGIVRICPKTTEAQITITWRSQQVAQGRKGGNIQRGADAVRFAIPEDVAARGPIKVSQGDADIEEAIGPDRIVPVQTSIAFFVGQAV